MTYKEIRTRLDKCQYSLEQLKSGKYTQLTQGEINSFEKKLNLVKESLTKQLKESEKNVLLTTKKGETSVLQEPDDDTLRKLKTDPNIEKIKSTDGTEIKEQDAGFNRAEIQSISKKVGEGVLAAHKKLGEQLREAKANMFTDNGFTIQVIFKNGNEAEYDFYIEEDTLMYIGSSYDEDITDVGVLPSGEAVVNVSVIEDKFSSILNKILQENMKEGAIQDLEQQLLSLDKGAEITGGGYGPFIKHSEKSCKNSKTGKFITCQALAGFLAGFSDVKVVDAQNVNEAPGNLYYIKISKDAASQNKAQVIFNDLYNIDYELNDDPDGVVMYFKKEDFDAGLLDDLEGDGVHILDTNIPDINEDAEEDAKNDADYEAGWHDDPRKDEDISATELPPADEVPEAPEAEGDLDIGHQDDEPNMLKKDLYDIITYASKLYKQLDKYDQHDGEVDFPHWWQKKVTLSREYMSAAQHYLEGEEKQPAIDQLALENVADKNLYDGIIGRLVTDMLKMEQYVGEHGNPEERKKFRTLKFALEDFDDYMAYGKSDGALEERVVNEGRGDLQTIIGVIEDRASDSGFSVEDEAEEVIEAIQDHYNLDMYGKQKGVEENVDKVAGGIPYRRHGNKVIISEPLDDATKERLLKKAKELGYFAQPNQAGGITITLKGGMNERLNGDQQSALMDLQNILDRAAQLGDEARSIIKDTFPEELRGAEAYDVFNFGSSSNSYDNTLESLISDIEQRFSEDEGDDDLDEGIAKTKKAHDLVVTKMKELAKHYKAGDKSVVGQLKDLTAKKKSLEAMLDKDVAGTGVDQEIEEAGPGFAHDCAAKVVHEKYGKGNCIPEKHTLVKEGKKYVVTHYDVLFENGKTVTDIPVSELDVKTSNEHWHKGYKKKKK